MTQKKPTGHYVLCVNNDGYPASLEMRKVYQTLPDPAAEAKRFIRVVDESGEDYLFPDNCFVAMELSRTAELLFVKGVR